MSEYVTVYVANGQLDAEMVRGFLEASGIPAMISQESVGKVFGLASGPLGEVNVLVPVENSEEALDLLKSMESGDLIEGDADGESSTDEDEQDGEENPEGTDEEDES
jgi:Putative prokaryotic signal transducing protein